MLAQEQAVIRRSQGLRKEVEAAVGVGETEGTLILTDRRLVYVHGDEKEVALPIGEWSAKRLYFADVDALDSMVMDSASVEIPLSVISKASGHKLEALAPKLEVTWTDGGNTRKDEFVQQVTGRSRRKNLDDWAGVIQRLKAGSASLVKLPPAPKGETLEGKVMVVLGDMQQKGLFTIEEEVEERYKVDLDPDDVEAACARLVASGLVKRFSASDEDDSFARVSALGEDDLTP
ncbi:MAG: hypothetical protein JRM90_06295 [Nitrososphaerota archaeon]|jgi:hypothetical protein|nr:hypothetical protein [Nitrososphaerota archaeon]